MFADHDITMPFADSFSPVYEDLPFEGPTESMSTTTTTTTTTTISGDSLRRLYQGADNQLIPVYCSILAAVVVGIVAFVIFKK